MHWTIHIAYAHDAEYINVEADSEEEAIGKAVRRASFGEPMLLAGWWPRTDADLAWERANRPEPVDADAR